MEPSCPMCVCMFIIHIVDAGAGRGRGINKVYAVFVYEIIKSKIKLKMNKANKDSYIEAYILMSDRFRILIYTTVIVLRLLIVYWLCTSVAFSVIFFSNMFTLCPYKTHGLFLQVSLLPG